MEEMRDQGASLQTIADELGTSRQVKGRYLTRPPMPGCTMQMIYMYRKQPAL